MTEPSLKNCPNCQTGLDALISDKGSLNVYLIINGQETEYDQSKHSPKEGAQDFLRCNIHLDR